MILILWNCIIFGLTFLGSVLYILYVPFYCRYDSIYYVFVSEWFPAADMHTYCISNINNSIRYCGVR